MKKIFSGTSLKECLDTACMELKVSRDKLNYKIISKTRRLFKTIISIEVSLKDEKLREIKELKENDGFVEVQKGVIKVANPKLNGKPAYISSSDNLTVIVNGEKVRDKKEVFEDSKIEIIFPENEAKRILNIKTTPDKLEAYISINYEPKKIFKLKDKDKSSFVILETEVIEKKYPPLYSEEDIKNELIKRGIRYGIIEENIKLAASSKKNVNDLIVAKGIKAVNGEDDVLNILFKNKNKNIANDDEKTIDYRNKNNIVTVKVGDILAEKIVGKDGNDGINVYGERIKRKRGKKIKLRVRNGCRIENNRVIATIDGRPEYRSSSFNVNPLYQLNRDVNLETGNINFIGDVAVYGNVNEGMRVKSGGSVLITGNVSDAEIVAKYDIQLKKNVILSHIRAGGEDVEILNKIDYLKQINYYIKEIKSAVEQIQQQGKFNDKIKLGQVVKLLLESKYKDVSKLFVKFASSVQSSVEDSKIIMLIKNNFIGFGPLNIKEISQITEIIDKVQQRIDDLNQYVSIPSNIEISYCQNCKLESSGNIIITGRGEYVSNIVANDSVTFQDERAIARGGSIKAKNKIECSIVGSEGAVKTELMVERKGHIYIKKVFPNTIIIVGNLKNIVNVPRKNVHAYIDADGELQVEGLRD